MQSTLDAPLGWDVCRNGNVIIHFFALGLKHVCLLSAPSTRGDSLFFHLIARNEGGILYTGYTYRNYDARRPMKVISFKMSQGSLNWTKQTRSSCPDAFWICKKLALHTAKTREDGGRLGWWVTVSLLIHYKRRERWASDSFRSMHSCTKRSRLSGNRWERWLLYATNCPCSRFIRCPNYLGVTGSPFI